MKQLTKYMLFKNFKQYLLKFSDEEFRKCEIKKRVKKYNRSTVKIYYAMFVAQKSDSKVSCQNDR
jgi:hypothetical protein